MPFFCQYVQKLLSVGLPYPKIFWFCNVYQNDQWTQPRKSRRYQKYGNGREPLENIVGEQTRFIWLTWRNQWFDRTFEKLEIWGRTNRGLCWIGFASNRRKFYQRLEDGMRINVRTPGNGSEWENGRIKVILYMFKILSSRHMVDYYQQNKPDQYIAIE